MTTENKKTKLMKELLKNMTDIPVLPQAGDLVDGKIVKITNTEMVVDLGPIGTGIIYGAELKENRTAMRELKVGQTISALVVDAENEDGCVELSLKKAFLEKAWNKVKAQRQDNETAQVKVIEANRGGLVIDMYGLIGFLPVSQLAPENYPHVEDGDRNKILQHLNQFIGQKIEVKIIGMDRENNKLIVSERAAKEEKPSTEDQTAKSDPLLSTLAPN